MVATVAALVAALPVILLLIPSQNPDGQEMVAGWYDRNRGTTFDASPLPDPHHPYAGRDDNRDAYMLTRAGLRRPRRPSRDRA